MIAKSDLLILTLSSGALAVGIYRWQENTAVVPPRAAPSIQVEADAPPADERAPTLVSAARDRDDGAADPTAPVVRRVSTSPADGTGSGSAFGAAPERPVAVTANLAPRPAAAPTAVPAPSGDRDAATGDGEPLYGVYRVRSGDYLGKIAQRFGTSVGTLREINGIEGSLIEVDQELRYPLPAN